MHPLLSFVITNFEPTLGDTFPLTIEHAAGWLCQLAPLGILRAITFLLVSNRARCVLENNFATGNNVDFSQT
jgi:hypothetical protein